jgi:signal transduction histidine kinase
MTTAIRTSSRLARACTFVLAGWASGVAWAAEFPPPLAEDGRSIVLESPAGPALRAEFRAVVERDGRGVELVSRAAAGRVERSTGKEATPFGEAAVEQASIRFAAEGCELLLRCGRIPGVPGFTVQSGVTNIGAEPLRLVGTSPLSMAGTRAADGSRRVFLTTGMAKSIWQLHEKPLDLLSFNKTPIRIYGEGFARGIGCLSPSDMQFPLGGRFSRFQCVVGVDETGSGSVTFEVHVDGRKLFDSGLMLAGQAGRVVDLDVTGAQELKLVVTDAGDGPNYDFANWADASLTPVAGIDSILPPADAARIRLGSPPGNWLAGPMLGDTEGAPPRQLDRIFDPLTVREAGGLYDAEGRGLFFGPVGTPVCYLTGSIGNAGNGHATLDIDCAMDSVEVAPGETRWGQQVMLSFESPRAARERWISWVADSHRARAPREAMSGWLSWYWLGMNVSENNLMEIVDFAAKSGGVLRPSVIQIDDGYQADGGSAGEMNAKFPSGTQGMASRIAAAGSLPGLFTRLGRADPERVDQFLGGIRDAVASGIRYLKISDFEIPPGPRETRTSFERKRAFYQAIRQAAGDNTYLMTATYVADRASVGMVDACRVNGSMERHRAPLGVDAALRSLDLNRRWFTVDTDCYYLATGIDKLAPMAGGWPMLRSWLSITGLACGNAMTSDPWHWEAMSPHLRHAEILTPPAAESATALDLGTSPGLSRVVGHVRRPWGNWTVALLLNTGPQAREITLDFASAGMAADTRYAVWSFWENRFLGIAEKSWTTPALDPMASAHLCFTPLEGDPLKPTIVGSNFHVWCGAAEFERVTALHGAMEVRFSDAGARGGDLFIHCGARPEIRGTNACKVAAIEPMGENIWRVSLADRQRGMPQRIEFGVYRHVTRQPWFWLLILLLVASIAFATWRYLENLRARREIARLQQKSALEEERARIARDLHDELGANLARIGLLTELADQAIGDPDKTRHQLGRILTATRGITRQLDSVVWAVDPANDTLESLARYLHGHAEDYLSIAGIRCRFEASDLPEMPLSSSLRHHLLMIAKEALHNIVKHSWAATATLRLDLTGSRLTLSVEDDGCGCSAPGDGRRRGNGLNNMAKRAQAAGGAIAIRPGTNGRGTVVVFTLDLPAGP